MLKTIERVRAARREDRGFTLIELLVVIIILGVLAAVVVFSVRGINDSSEEAACQTNFRTAVTAAEAWYAQEGSDAGSWSVLVPDFLHDDPSASGDPRVDVGGTPAAPTKGTACP